MNSEFKQFLDTLKRLGIEFSINWQPTKEFWQQIIKMAGYNISAFNYTVVEIRNIQYLFSNGPLCWTKGGGYGPNGLFMLSRDKISGEIWNRVLFNKDGLRMPLEGWQAAVVKYPDQYWGSFKE